jgi:hypothetical protein
MINNKDKLVKEIKMSDLEKLIEMCKQLCDSLDRCAEQEKKFCTAVCMQLERYSWEMLRMSDDIRNIKEMFGG